MDELKYNVELTSYEITMKKDGETEILTLLDENRKARIVITQPKIDDIDWGEKISADKDKHETLKMSINV